MCDNLDPDTCARLAIAGHVLAQVLADAPSADLARQLSDPIMLDTWPLSGGDSEVGVSLLRGLDGQSESGEALREDHFLLLRGPGRALVQPHESVYTSPDHLVFDVATLEVRGIYRRWGLEVALIGREPDDHIAYEVAFVSQLVSRLPALGVAGRDRALGDLRAMVGEHLSVFVGDVAGGLIEHARTRTYRACGHLLSGWFASVSDAVGCSS
ncbi:MAG: molecular chaperone TorD family protein [Actinomycetaceae bacterium]|nr:molecular chaperone TorD family protein [Actinomycetaceae bacterium]